jgi:hypothetical protein
MRYARMSSPTDPTKRIADTEALITRAEERIRNLQARAKPGTARMVHALTNNIRGYRRDLQNLLARQRSLRNQKLHQERQMQQAKNDASANHNDDLPAKQDQEPRKLASNEGRDAGQ